MDYIAVKDLKRPRFVREKLHDEGELLLMNNGRPMAILLDVDEQSDPHVLIDAVRDALRDGSDLELRARRVTEQMALALQGALLVRHAPPAVADAFCVSRLGGDHGRVYGTLPSGLDLDALVRRGAPPV